MFAPLKVMLMWYVELDHVHCVRGWLNNCNDLPYYTFISIYNPN